MDTITYRKLTTNNFSLNSLDDFILRQDVKECWRRVNGILTLVPVAYIEDWDPAQRRETAEEVIKELENGGLAYGAFCGNKIVGFASLAAELFGSQKQYMDMAMFYVSEPFRRQGIGRELFKMACRGAADAGAQKLYISAHSARESMAAYERLGCAEAKEINQILAEKEPCDVQLEYAL